MEDYNARFYCKSIRRRPKYDPADAGKTAHYMLRWRMRDGSVSAWSETISATITG